MRTIAYSANISIDTGIDVTTSISGKPVSIVCILITYQFFENGKTFNLV